MRPPSGRVLINRVDLYRATMSQDADAAPQFVMPAIPQQTDVPCSVQYTGTEELVSTGSSGQERITVQNLYMVMFADNPGLTPRDTIVWTDMTPPRTLMIKSNPPSEAGRGRPYCVHAIEKI